MKLKDLEYRVNYLNKITKNRVEKHLPYKINNEMVSNKGHYYISIYNGSYGLEQIVNTSGGCTDISYRGSKKEIANWLNAFIKGIETQIYK
jgi:hypothetical protein